MLWEIGVLIAAIAFAILVYYVIEALRSLKYSLDEMRVTLIEVKHEISAIGTEVKSVVQTTNSVADDVNMKLKSLDSLFGSLDDVGHVVQEATSAVKESAVALISSVKSGQKLRKERAAVQAEAEAARPKVAVNNTKTELLAQGATLAAKVLQLIVERKSAAGAAESVSRPAGMHNTASSRQ
ncbi:DUF948 domain-containing protein [Paenibacillus sp. FSL H8-0537]|uniref:DUF948 domain-containing protein n=1 Tax=Paenibacillus sp. FSL H8-0537 TaxID=2921399 RepID=UPI003100DD8E